jgi:ribosomal protein S18 acetylase RimI-like enzyme
MGARPRNRPMTAIRPYRADDLDALYRICLATGDAGEDGAALYRDPKIVGHVYAAPHAVVSPETAFVVEDGEGVGGYIVGPADTLAFEERLETEWWPRLRAIYPDRPEMTSMDDRMAHLIHHPDATSRRICQAYPAHLHINLLPRLRRRGVGTRLMDTWLARVAELGAVGACLGVGARNAGAVAFYQRYGFREIEREDDGAVILFGIETARSTA